MNMMAEIEKLMGSVGTSWKYRIINLGGNTLYLEGLKSVVCFDECEMRFQLKHGCISIKGQDLKVKYLDKTTCVIIGQIKAVEEL